MAQVNTGKAFFVNLYITISQSGTQNTVIKSILAAIPGTAYGEISLQDFITLTEPQAQARYTAFYSYWFSQYSGFVISDIANNPINTNTTLCPI